jgi:protein BCP1
MPQKKKLKSNEDNKNHKNAENEPTSSSNDEEMSEEYDSEDDYSGEDDDDDDNEYDFDPNEEIMIDFEARSLRETDLDSTKLMLQAKLGPFNNLNLNELAQIIVKQENLGNAIYQVVSNEDEEEEEPEQEKADKKEQEEDHEFLDDTIFGILSIVDLSTEKYKQFSAKFVEFLLKQCQTHDKENHTKLKDKLNELFNTKRVCYVINERYVNIPPAISVPMFDSLQKDLENLNPEENACNQADYWLVLSKYFIEEPKNECNGGARSSKSQQNEYSSNLIYTNPEEEILEEFGEFKFEISYNGKISKATGWSVDDPSLQPYLKAFLIPKNKINDALTKVKTEIK